MLLHTSKEFWEFNRLANHPYVEIRDRQLQRQILFRHYVFWGMGLVGFILALLCPLLLFGIPADSLLAWQTRYDIATTMGERALLLLDSPYSRYLAILLPASTLLGLLSRWSLARVIQGRIRFLGQPTRLVVYRPEEQSYYSRLLRMTFPKKK